MGEIKVTCESEYFLQIRPDLMFGRVFQALDELDVFLLVNQPLRAWGWNRQSGPGGNKRMSLHERLGGDWGGGDRMEVGGRG